MSANRVPVPAGAVETSDWCDVGHPDEFRTFSGPTRSIPGLAYPDSSPAMVLIFGTQLRDGTVEGRCIRVGGVHWDDEIDAETARALGRALLDAADDLDTLQR